MMKSSLPPPQHACGVVTGVVTLALLAAPGGLACSRDSLTAACNTDAECTTGDFCDGTTCRPRCSTKSSSNLMTNPGFDGSTNGWTLSRAPTNGVVPPERPPPYNDKDDAAGCSTSGAITLDFVANFDDGGIWSPLFPVTSGTNYFIGHVFRDMVGTPPNPPGTPPNPPPCTVNWCSAPDCQLNVDHRLLGGDSLPVRNHDSTKVWQRIDEVVTSPLGAVAGFLSCSTADRSLFDRFYVSETTPLY
jgi:hypothetical protein